jgi:hypothetical protein
MARAAKTDKRENALLQSKRHRPLLDSGMS